MSTIDVKWLKKDKRLGYLLSMWDSLMKINRQKRHMPTINVKWLKKTSDKFYLLSMWDSLKKVKQKNDTAYYQCGIA